MQSALKRLAADRAGATAIEYALIAGLISLALIAAVGGIGPRLISVFEQVAAATPQP